MQTLKNDIADLWCHELRRTAERTCRISEPHVLFAQSIVSNFDMPVQRKENVVKFQIAKNRDPLANPRGKSDT